MKRIFAAVLFLSASLAAIMPAQARDSKLLLPIEAGMESKSAGEKLDGSVKFYFGTQKHPKVLAKLGTDSTSKKTNAFNKTDDTACNWAFLSAMVALEKRAYALGANAVVNIVSNYSNHQFSSNTEFECHAGGIMAGVALKGDFVKIGKK